MQKEVFSESVPWQSLPPHVQKKFPKEKFLRVQYQPDREVELDDDGKPMPPVSAISPEFIEMMKESEEDVKAGRCTTVKAADVQKHLDNL